MPHKRNNKKTRAIPSIPVPVLTGEKGTLEYSSEQVGEKLVALFFSLVRDLPQTRLVELVNEVFQQAILHPTDAPRIIADVFVLAFQTRDCRGGKGEKSIFYHLLIELFHNYPETVLKLLPFLGEYGYYKDYFNLLALIHTEGGGARYERLQNHILDLIVEQLKKDERLAAEQETKMDTEEAPVKSEGVEEESTEKKQTTAQTVSLCAKYAPREAHEFQKKHKEVFKALVLRLFPSESTTADEQQQAYQRAKRLYRKLIAQLTAIIDVPEVKMCGKRFASIAFDHVPSVCLKKNRKAFGNEKLKEAVKPTEYSTGNRSMDLDRIQCRQNLIQALKDKKVKGKQNFPHELVSIMMKGGRIHSVLENELMQAQWDDIRNGIVNSIAEVKAAALAASGGKATKGGLDLGKLVPLVDVSGSMSGTPMEVAIALGILISEINHPLFRNRFITFETSPHWVDLTSCATINDKVQVTKQASWGGSTDVEKALALVSDMVEQHALPEEEVPDLIIFSDMQFDEAVGATVASSFNVTEGGPTVRGDGKGQLQRIQDRFAAVGKKISGHAYKMPRIIFWNLRGNTSGYPATATSENVQMLSGFSPSLFKHLIDGSEIEEEDGGAAGGKGSKVNPYTTFRKAMDDERYEKIREVLSNSEEGFLSQYTYEKK